MSFKLLFTILLPIGFIVILKELGVYTLKTSYDVALIGAILMIIFQIINLLISKIHNGHLSIMNILTASFFILISLTYVASVFITPILFGKLELILGIIMIVEALYAMH